MIRWVNYAMVYLGSALMVYNIYGFVKYARFVQKQKAWDASRWLLNVPILLLVLFLLGYLGIGIFGRPDLLVAAILFGGSIFVFVMYLLLSLITQRIIENEKLKAELIAAEESSRVKTSFLSSVSHEMRTPMNVILGLNSIALKNPALPSELREPLEKIGLSAKHLLDLINNILDMNRIESGEYTIKSERFSLREMLTQMDAIAVTLCHEKGLTYETDVQDGIYGDYLGDETELRHVLLSLLDNAAKYTDAPGTVRFSVEGVSADEDKRLLRFTVADTGIGMSEEFLTNLFTPFTQEDTSSTSRFGGGGMSLAVAKGIVDRMGGRISAESEKGRGSVFTVTLPLMSTASEAPPEEPEVSLEGRRILIVEDIPENAEIAADLLELEGAESEHAENGQIALCMIERSTENYYDAVLMDLRMPVMDGLEAARRIRAMDRADAKTLPIIALTANAFESDIQQSLDAGMNAHLAKPTDADLLYATLKSHIRK